MPALSGSRSDHAWDPGFDYSVKALAVSQTTLYVGGDFCGCSGLMRPHLVGFDFPPQKTTYLPLVSK